MEKVLKAYHQAKYMLAESSDGDSKTGKLLREKFPIEFFETLRDFVTELEDHNIHLVDNQLN